MGAGDCPEAALHAESELLKQAMELGLGFSESQLCNAIKGLVEAFGSYEEVFAWIQQQNFTLLVDYILDNADLDCQQSRSPVRLDEIRKIGTVATLSDHGEKSQAEESNGNLPKSQMVKKEEVSDGSFECLSLAKSNGPILSDGLSNNSSLTPRKTGRLDRNALRLHYKKKLSRSSKAPEQVVSVDFPVTTTPAQVTPVVSIDSPVNKIPNNTNGLKSGAHTCQSGQQLNSKAEFMKSGTLKDKHLNAVNASLPSLAAQGWQSSHCKSPEESSSEGMKYGSSVSVPGLNKGSLNRAPSFQNKDTARTSQIRPGNVSSCSLKSVSNQESNSSMEQFEQFSQIRPGIVSACSMKNTSNSKDQEAGRKRGQESNRPWIVSACSMKNTSNSEDQEAGRKRGQESNSAPSFQNKDTARTSQIRPGNVSSCSLKSVSNQESNSSMEQFEHFSQIRPGIVSACSMKNTSNSKDPEAGRKGGQESNRPGIVSACSMKNTSNSKDQEAGKKRGQESNSLIETSQKRERLSGPRARLELVPEVRTSMPSECQDLATGDWTIPQGVKPKSAERKSWSPNNDRHSTSQLPQDDARIQSGIVVKHDTVKEAVAEEHGAAHEKISSVVLDLEAIGELRSSLSKHKSKDKSCALKGIKKEETCVGDVVPLKNDGQKASCSKSDGGANTDFKQSSVMFCAESSWVVQLEACLKEGNCERAIEVFMAWKKEGFKVETQRTEEDRFLLEGGGHEMLADIPGKKRGFVVSYDISRGLEKLPISCVNEYNLDMLPEDFLYVTSSVIRAAAHVDTSFSRIGDLHCCCSDDCLRSPEACKCTDSTRGGYAYNENGQLIDRLATSFQSGCATQNGDFITECCMKCRCSMKCGNRIVQRGITKKLQVFMTPTRKGWGVRALEKILARSFVFEYLGEVATNDEQFYRNMEYAKNGVYTYTMNLDADFDMEKKHFGEGLNDTEALVLDATIFGNVSRFVNHRCIDANLFMRPVQIETRDTHYYHAAFFAVRDIQEMEELTWDYGIDFNDSTHQVKAFKCRCNSPFCRDKAKKRKAVKHEGAK